ncbi:hypothetical protein ID866_9025 [Astraeus odoratus]|nr:hypothetical protein ID866_9025 [Astraeus odoratus]
MSSRPSPRWRRPYSTNTKSVHPPALTFVLAEPKQASTLHSATTKLPIILRSAPHPKSPSETSSMKSKAHEDSSEAVARITGQPPAGRDDVASANQDATSAAPAETVAQPDESGASAPDGASTAPPDPVPAPPTAAARPPSPPAVPDPTLTSKRPWFSWSWGQGTETKSEPSLTPIAQPSAPTGVDSSEEPPKLEPSVQSSPDRSSSITAEAPIGDARSVSSPDDVTVAQSSPPGCISQSPTGKAKHSGPLTTLQSAENAGSSVSLNSTSSRFTLGLPLLGRPKLPLDKAVAMVQEDESRDVRQEQFKSGLQEPTRQDPGVTVQALKEGTPLVAGTSETSEAPVPSPAEQADPKDHSDTAQMVSDNRTSSWWPYFGWGISSNNQHSQPQTLAEPVDPLGTSPTNDVLHLRSAQPPPPPPTSSSTQLEAEYTPNALSGPESNGKEESFKATDNGTCATSYDTSASQGSVWYTPWTWYQKSSVGALSDCNASTNAVPQNSDYQQPDTTGQDVSSPEDATGSATGPINPIQSTIPNNRAGWISFFSSRAMAMKSITYEKEGGEMEVMDIDEDATADQDAGTHTSATSAAGQVSSSKEVKQPQFLSANSQNTTSVKKGDGKLPPKAGTAIVSETVARETMVRQPSPTPSKKSGVKTPTTPPPPNVVLPTWADVFHSPPRSIVPGAPLSGLSKVLKSVAGVWFSRDESMPDKGKGKVREAPCSPYEKALPRAWNIVEGETNDVLRGCQRVVVIGVHGWFPGAVARTFIGEPTGTSSKFVNRVVQALDEFQERHNVKLAKITKIPLEGEGTIIRRVEKLYQNLTSNEEWMNDLHEADAIFIATHSQGSVVSTHILDRLISDRHIRTKLTTDTSILATGVASGSVHATGQPQRICCLALCGIHLGPLRYLNTNSLLSPYIQYFESTAARELFEFQNTESAISKEYVRALRNVLDNGIKMVYIASLNDQVVGLYSGLFASVSHPLILRALYIDGDAYHSSDFLSKLLVLLIRVRNAGLSDSGLLTHLSEATAGSLNGIGHSTPYEELATYT